MQEEAVETPTPLTLTQLNVETQVLPVDEFLFNTPRSTLQALKDATTEQVNVVLGTVKRILNPDSYWYTACVCNKAVIPDSRMFYCEKCNKHVSRVFPRFCIKVRVMDHTGGAGGAGGLPPQIADMVEKTWLFKVETKPTFNPRFEQSFRVRKICTDVAIINQFKAKWDNEEATFMKNTNENGSLSTLLLKGKDVLVDGSTNILSQDFESGSDSSGKGKGLILEGKPVEVTQDLMEKFSTAAVNLADDSLEIITGDIVHAVDKGKGFVVNLDDEEVSFEKGKSVVVKLDDDKVAVDQGKLAVVNLNDGKVAFDKGKQAVVKLADEELAKVQVVSEEKICDGPTKRLKKKPAGKRVSHTPQDEDDNTPIKLLKRAIKIEKIA